jgi:hypothetical protein
MTDCTPIQAELSEALDKELLDVIRNGNPVVDDKGNAVKDAKGKPVRQPASAAHFKVAHERLRFLGIGKVPQHGDAASQLADELGIHDPQTLKLPGVNTTEDDPATMAG